MSTLDFELNVSTEDVSFEVENKPDDVEADTSFTEQLNEVDGGAILVIDNHKDLKGRDLPNQHPTSAITGLETALNGKQDKLTAGSGIDITDGTIKNTGLLSATYEAENENLVLVGG